MFLKRLINILTSLRLTVVCLGLAMVLVFIGTFAQVRLGLYAAQENYFQSFFVMWGPSDGRWRIPVFPGGYLLGTVLLINLVAAHIRRFKWSRKKIGIFMVHAGLIVLLLGQLATELFSEESAMRISEGQSVNYSQSFRENELVVIDTSLAASNTVVSIPESMLAEGREIVVPQTPFKLRINQYWQNSDFTNAPTAGAVATGVTNGVGEGLFVVPRREATAMDDRDLPSSLVEVISPKGSLGTWLLSSQIGRRQSVDFEGKTYDLALRFTRHYKPYSMQLLDFSHDKYAGTQTPKNFSSRVVLDNPAKGENRERLIKMNDPLRYGGETYYQGSFDPRDDRVTILQVVRNPVWVTPYASCVLVGLGLVVQFMTHLIGFINKWRTA